MDLLRTITAERDDLSVQVADLIRERDEITDLLADTRRKLDEATVKLNSQIATTHDEGPYLGLATTETLFQELITRFKTEWMSSDTSVLLNVDRCIALAYMLGGLSAPEREYRTVDHD